MYALTPNAWLRWDIIRREIRRLDGDSFLEIGCGGGAMGARLAETYEYVGYESDPTSARLAQARIGNAGTVHAEPLPDVPGRSFSFVGAFEVLEHIHDDVGALRSWGAWLEPGGHVLLSVPANPDRWGPWDEKAGHVRRYTRAMITEALQHAGFDSVRVWMTGFPLGYILETARHAVAKPETDRTLEDRTADSGRLLQPTDRLAVVTELGTWPFRLVQRAAYGSELGTGLVAIARHS